MGGECQVAGAGAASHGGGAKPGWLTGSLLQRGEHLYRPSLAKLGLLKCSPLREGEPNAVPFMKGRAQPDMLPPIPSKGQRERGGASQVWPAYTFPFTKGSVCEPAKPG